MCYNDQTKFDVEVPFVFEVFGAAMVQVVFFRGSKPCSLLVGNINFGGTCCLHFWG
jgi:hypothetical protein